VDERVGQIMTGVVLSVDVHRPITEVLRLFASHTLHHLPVVDGLELKGMLSSADLLKLQHSAPNSGSMASAAMLNDRFKIATIMSRPVVVARLDDTISDAAASMASHGIHALAVVDENSHLVGIITTTDIMQALLHGMARKRGGEPYQRSHTPSELEMRRAVEAAESATQNGTDTDGIAATMLQLRARNALLEELRLDVARYLHAGQDERMHTRLVRRLERLGQAPIDMSGRL
jgi:CBS-domain-containing membrane protein